MNKTANIQGRLAHGGNLDNAVRQFGIPRDQWLDLSTGINPIPYPIGNPNRRAWSNLPDSNAEAALLSVAGVYYGVPDSACIVASPGTQALIQWLPRLIPHSCVVILGPTYAEHAHSWRTAGHKVVSLGFTEQLPENADVIVAVNPNNPDGYIHSPRDLIRLAKPDRLVIVDEAFADTQPSCSVIPATGQPGLLVLRSFGKFFGLAGMRLGFAITHADLANKLSNALGPWAVTGPALELGAKAFADDNWIAKTRLRLRENAERLDSLVKPRFGLALGGTDLFRLYRIDDTNLYSKLASEGILTRTFPEKPNILRLGLPPNDNGFKRLAKALF